MSSQNGHRNESGRRPIELIYIESSGSDDDSEDEEDRNVSVVSPADIRSNSAPQAEDEDISATATNENQAAKTEDSDTCSDDDCNGDENITHSLDDQTQGSGNDIGRNENLINIENDIVADQDDDNDGGSYDENPSSNATGSNDDMVDGIDPSNVNSTSSDDDTSDGEESGDDEDDGNWTRIFPEAVAEYSDKNIVLFEKIVPPPELPMFAVTVDLDSIYTVFETLADLTMEVGNKVEFSIPANTSINTASTSSRFAVDVSNLPTPTLISGVPGKVIPMEFFPNVQIATVLLKEVGITLHISIFDMGVKSARKSGRFQMKELAVINASLNLASELSKRHSTENSGIIAKKFNAWKRVSTPVGKKKWQKTFRSFEKTNLSPDMMAVFSSNFQVALNHIAENTNTYQFYMPRYTGFHYESVEDSPISRQGMVEYAQQLRMSMVFVANAAGTKGLFDRPTFCKTVEFTEDFQNEFMQKLEENKTTFLCELNKVSSQEELTPAMISKGLPIESIYCMECFDDIFPGFEDTVVEEYQEVVDELSGRLYSVIQSALSCEGNSDHLWNFDFGSEFFSPVDKGTILINLENTYTALEEIMSKRYVCFSLLFFLMSSGKNPFIS